MGVRGLVCVRHRHASFIVRRRSSFVVKLHFLKTPPRAGDYLIFSSKLLGELAQDVVVLIDSRLSSGLPERAL